MKAVKFGASGETGKLLAQLKQVLDYPFMMYDFIF